MKNAKPRRVIVALAAAAALTVAAIGAGVGSAAQTHARPHWTRSAWSRSVFVVEHAITDQENPVGTDVKGNILTFNNPVYNQANTQQVGHDEGFCTRVDPKLGIWECLWTTFLPAGQITVQGPYYDNANSVLSITGGTGAYRDSRGQMQLVSQDNGTEYDFIFQLS